MNRDAKKVLLLILIILLSMLCTTLNVFAEQEELKIYDSKIDFKHFDYKLNTDNSMKSYNKNSIVSTTFNTKVIENKYIKVTLLPEYGGRILSINYKPTGHELLYQNPVGTPYGIGENNFYYNWLMVYGGIFPTFPEPEHGKAWNLPWEYKIVEQNQDKISVEMRFTDKISPVQGTTPNQFSKGRTDITCISTVTVYRNTSYVDYNIKLVNNRNEPVMYEYWTCTTLAPGSEPGNTICPPNTEIVVPIEKVKLKDDWWPWMGTAERAIDQNAHVFEYKNLALFSNWADMGIAYANPSVDKDWWGVINHSNEEGILRIANNKQFTPGLKFWTWGDKSRNTNTERFGDSSRPYIELWAGNSLEFQANSELAPNGQKTWTEYYMPTVGLSKVTYANQHAAVDMNYTSNETDDKIDFSAKIFSTHPEESLKVNLKLKGNKEYNLYNETFVSDPATANSISVPIERSLIDEGNYAYELILKTSSDEVLMQTDIPFNSSIKQPKTNVDDKQEQEIKSSTKETSKDTLFKAKTVVTVVIALVAVILISLVIYKKNSKGKNNN